MHIARHSFVEASVAAALAFGIASAPRHALGYCRTTTDVTTVGGCATAGLPLFWQNACVGYSISRATGTIPLSAATTVIDKSFATWSNVTCPASGENVGIDASNLGPVDCNTIGYNKNGPNQNLIVFYDANWPYNDPNNTLGLTTVTFNTETGEIYDADMEINNTGGNVTTSDVVPPTGYDLQSIVTHEAGHFFGLAHSPDPSATMYPSYKEGSSSLRTLAADDIAGICEIYPNVDERSVAGSFCASGFSAAGACDPTPRHGFSSSCNGVSSDSSPASAAECIGGLSGGCSVGRTPLKFRSSCVGFVIAGVAGVVARRRTRRS
ncbi:MAG: M10 family metallopeptidase domain-containing protein [Polyangiaceae bacterium]|nr:M10 family metallopeptidase domain-containing protein [Polyangiaceae bacterium]